MFKNFMLGVAKKFATETKNTAIVASAGRGNFQTLANAMRSGGRTRSGLSQYQKELVLDHYATRQNARVALHDSTQARVLVKRQRDYIIGAGLKLEPTPAFDILGITREQSKEWSKNVKKRFDLWARSKDSDITGRNNFYQNMRFTEFQYNRDGEYFIRIHYSKDKNLQNPIQISFIDPNQIRGDEFTFSSGPTGQNDGIIRDENGKEIAYKIWSPDYSNPGRYTLKEIPAYDKKTGRPIILHGFDPEYTGQGRGISELAHALQDFEDITTFDVATTQKAINGASLNFTVKNMQQDPSDMGLPNLISGAGPGVNVTAETSAQQVVPQNLGLDGVEYCSLNEATIREPGGVNLLSAAQGDELVAIPNNAPSENHHDFIDGKFKYLSASMSMPEEVASMKFTSSFSASKGALGLYENVAQAKRDDIASDFLNIIYMVWLAEEIAAGRVRAPGFTDRILRQAWTLCRWIGNRPPDLNPVQTVNAIKGAVEMGLTSLERAAENYNGSDWEANNASNLSQIPQLPTDPFKIREIEEPEIETETEEDED